MKRFNKIIFILILSGLYYFNIGIINFFGTAKDINNNVNILINCIFNKELIKKDILISKNKKIEKRKAIKLSNALEIPEKSNSLKSEIDKISNDATILNLQPGTWLINEDLVIPSNIFLKVEKGAILNVIKGKILKIEGGFDCGPYQSFCLDTNSQVRFGANSIKEAYPQWWGAKGDGIKDDSLAIIAAINAIKGTDIFLVFSAGEYLVKRQGEFISDWGDKKIYYVAKIDNRLNIKGNGTIKCSQSDQDYATPFVFYGSINDHLIQCSITGIKFNGINYPNNMFLHSGAAVIFYYCDNCYAEKLNINNFRSGILSYFCTNIDIRNCESSIIPFENSKYGEHYCLYGCKYSTISNCKSWGNTGDGDMGIFGFGSEGNIIRDCQLTVCAKGDVTQNIKYAKGQGISVDSGAAYSKIINNSIYGYYYGIDVKTNSNNTLVEGNFLKKCKAAITQRMGDVTKIYAANLSINNNIIIPDGGNGNVENIMNIPDMATIGIMLENPLGTIINGNTISNSFNVGNKDFCGILSMFSDSNVSDANKSGIVITGNKISSSVTHSNKISYSKLWGIYLSGNRVQRLTDIVITGNNFNLKIHASVLDKPPIFMVLCKNVIISGNTFSTAGRNQHSLAINNSDNINIIGNTFEGSSGIINASLSKNMLVSNNIIQLSKIENDRSIFDINKCNNILITYNLINGINKQYWLNVKDCEDIKMISNIIN